MFLIQLLFNYLSDIADFSKKICVYSLWWNAMAEHTNILAYDVPKDYLLVNTAS